MSKQRGGTPTKNFPPMEPVKVVVRMRGLNQYELGTEVKGKVSIKNGIARSWKVKEHRSCVQTTNTGESLPRKEGRTCFTYDKVFDEHASTKEVFDESASDIITSFVNGISGSIIAYGQTASGKTYTMQGKGSLKDGAVENTGVIQMAIQALFEGLAKQQSSVFLLRAAVIEVHNEEIKDLLLPSDEQRKVTTRYDSKAGIVMDATEIFVTDYSSMIDLFSLADENRTVRKTEMNDRSSRSHMMIKITLEKKHIDDSDGEEKIQVSTMNLVDLAGSDTVMTKARNQDEAQKEGSNINKSLLALSHVIADLARSRKGFVNYRDSNLTKVLQKDLKSHCKLAVICCITPSGMYTEQTRKTLEFGKYAGGVKTRPGKAVVKDDRSIIIKTLRDLYNTRSSPRASEEKKQEVEMKWREIERAFIIGNPLDDASDSNISDDEEAKPDKARNESTIPVDDDSPDGHREGAAKSQASEETEECELSVVLSVAEQRMTEIEEEWQAMKCTMDERSIASGAESGYFAVSKSSIPNEIEFNDDDESMLADELEIPYENGLNRLEKATQEDISNATAILSEIICKSDETGDDLSALLSSGSEESDLIQSAAGRSAAQDDIIITKSGLSMKSEISVGSNESPGMTATRNTLPDVNTSTGLNDSMEVFVDNEQDLLTYSEDSASNYSKNKIAPDSNKNLEMNTCSRIEELKAKISQLTMENKSMKEKTHAEAKRYEMLATNFELEIQSNKDDTEGKEKIIKTLEAENEGLLHDIAEISTKLDQTSKQADQLPLLEESKQLILKKNEMLEEKVASLLENLDQTSKQADQLPLLKESTQLILKKNEMLEEKVASLLENLDQTSKQADQLPLLEESTQASLLENLAQTSKQADQLPLLKESTQLILKKNEVLEEEVESLSNLLQPLCAEDVSELVSKVNQVENRPDQKEAQDSNLLLLPDKINERNVQVPELAHRVTELEHMNRNLEGPRKSTDPDQQRTQLEVKEQLSEEEESTLLSINSQESEETSLQDSMGEESKDSSPSSHRSSASKSCEKDDVDYTDSNTCDTSTSSDALYAIGECPKNVLNPEDMPTSDEALLDKSIEHQRSHELVTSKEETTEQNLAEIDDSNRKSEGESNGFDSVVNTNPPANGKADKSKSRPIMERNDNETDGDQEAQHGEDKENSGALTSNSINEIMVQTNVDRTLSPKIVAAMKGDESMLKQWENLSTSFRHHRQQVYEENFA